MNPSGLRLEEKKSADEVRSHSSYKSTHSTRSSVLERAREYNRRIDEQNARGRAKSLERPEGDSLVNESSPRSKSTGRIPQSAPNNKRTTRERAMRSVRRDAARTPTTMEPVQRSSPSPLYNRGRGGGGHTMNNGMTASPVSQRAQLASHEGSRKTSLASRTTTPTSNRRGTSSKGFKEAQGSPSRSVKSSKHASQHPVGENQEAVVSPELLVDALSGHEDGLLAIAEKLMEHYDGGYDVMGEAIIDAFADVQKLFQHVVEAAHMEGAAFESSRRESEIAELRRKAAGEVSLEDHHSLPSPSMNPASPNGGPMRHDEFIDQDVKDILTEAIRKGTALRDANRHGECFELYENSCQAASALLPVDSDHRGRLQLSIARAESMSPERACAILRYAMDDVLRSGMRAGRTPLPDPSKRADVVLSRPKGHTVPVAGQAGVVQSSDEALASLIEEMKEILSAPVYSDTPLQGVARRFWTALSEAQKTQQKNEEKLEQNLGKLKVEFLLARAEWEEKLSQSNETADSYKEKYQKLKETMKAEGYMDQARSFGSRTIDSQDDNDVSTMFGSVRSHATKSGSVASLGSGLAQQARTLVASMNNNFNCSNLNERNGPVVTSELDEMLDIETSRGRQTSSFSSPRTDPRPRSRSKTSRSYREYSHSPQRLDV